jgi:hypothetical protein
MEDALGGDSDKRRITMETGSGTEPYKEKT